MTELRSYTYIDRLQPQFAAYIGANARGYIPIPGMAAMLVEISPGVLINQVIDAAVKSADIRPGLMVVERHFGVLEFHSQAQEDVKHAGRAVLKVLNMTIKDRIKPKILNSQIIRKVNAYHAQMVNVSRLCSMLLPDQDLYILEVQPAAYVALAANEAEKNAQITLVDCRTFGAVGRLYVGGKHSDVERASGAAETAINGIDGKEG
jgi:ethanolamine utilization microcompartment shell protein EutL